MKNKKKRNIILLMTLIIFLAAGGFGINYWLRTQRYQSKVDNIIINDPDLSSIRDGEYIGEYDVDFISAKVKVTIESQAITDIEYIHHKNDRGEEASKITNDIIKQQKITVDTISGATNSSKVIQKAIELALSEK